MNVATVGMEIMAPPGMEEMTSQLQDMFQNFSGEHTKTRKLKMREAFKLMMEEEAAQLVNEDDIRARALKDAEQNGIVFLDELDKVAKRGETSGADVSREGVQRDLLPLGGCCKRSLALRGERPWSVSRYREQVDSKWADKAFNKPT